MRIFELNNKYNIVCNFKKTRNGFKHEATLLKNSISVYSTKECYLNRTWEAYEYETVLIEIVNAYFSGVERINFLNIVREYK